ncbi:MAG: type II toxin-antitoxin system VapC family toxin [Candidatus Thiodiazotropha sp. (ex Dulcina madagascariensis)]|nr:type II toxin-antitoxin system VapC family toxin [Candidatus Thiodiazotropha sp. (ex Dulcina madagascariensis)]MCU7926717.1 type II toxin-antitoxin system VapC family toxin [Candidatus Thiodiazotropha sp. (ex Dulcina madagascariensis)]
MIVIDTHILVWWVSGYESLSAAATKAITDTLNNGEEVIVSSISAWEIAMLIKKGRLILSMDVESWLNEVSQIDGVRFMPVDHAIGVKSTVLPGEFHSDPADRIIVATARKLAVSLVTADEKIIAYEHVKTIA